jgi:hypothetical protein
MAQQPNADANLE